MRTIDDLRTAFTDLADTAPDVDVLTAPTAAAVRRPLRRILAPAVAALAAAAIAGVLIATVPGDKHRQAAAHEPVAALPRPAAEGPIETTFGFTADLPVGRQVVRSYGIDRVGQRIEFRDRASAAQCSLVGPAARLVGNCGRIGMVTLFYAGGPAGSGVEPVDPDRLTGRVRQDVDGRRGYFGTPRSTGTPGLTDGLTSVHLFWEYAPGAWGDALAPTRARALALARSVRPSAGRFTVPAVLDPHAREYLDTFGVETSSVGGFYDIASTDAKHGTVRVAWGSGRYVKVGEVIDMRGTVIGGRTWAFYRLNGRAEAQLKNSATPIAVSGDVHMSLATLRAYLERVRFAPDLTDRSTWFAASTLR